MGKYPCGYRYVKKMARHSGGCITYTLLIISIVGLAFPKIIHI